MSETSDSLAGPRPAATSPAPARRVRPGAARWAIGLLGPIVLLSFAMGAAYALGHPPLDRYTGLNRWNVMGAVPLLGLGIGLWLLAGPSSALVYGAARALRLGAVAAIALAAVLPGLGWSLPGIWRRTGGPEDPLFMGEALFWVPAWIIASGACAVWLHLSLTLGLTLGPTLGRTPREHGDDA